MTRPPARPAPPSPAWRAATSLRTVSPADTVVRARALMAGAGITRVTDITRMDRLGLPVFVSVRPRGQTLCVHAGKGLAPEEAMAGALMEGLELAVVEQASRHAATTTMRLADLAQQLPPGDSVADFAPVLGETLSPQTPLRTLHCEDLLRGRPVAVPADLLLLSASGTPAPGGFQWHGTGLASGNTVDEATLHAVFEVLERDAVMVNRVTDGSAWVPLHGLPAPWRTLARDWANLGVELIVRHLPSVSGLPCFQAVLHEPDSTDVNLAVGYGLHLHPQIALSRAITEAAQSRLSTIHGGRDDLVDFYRKYDGMPRDTRRSFERQALERLTSRDRQRPFQALQRGLPSPPTSIAAVLQAVLRRLAAVGLGTVLRRCLNHDLPAPDLNGLQVVRVLIPGCENIPSSNRHAVGPRLLSRLLALQATATLHHGQAA